MEALTIQEIAGWLGQVRVPAVSVGVIGERSVNFTVGGALEMTVEAAGDTLSVSGERALPDEAQAALASVRLEDVVASIARAAAVPMTASTQQSGAKQRVAFTAPLFADGLTRNELASAVWCVWNAHDLLVRQIESYRQIEAISAEMQALREQEAEAPAAADVGPEALAGADVAGAPDAVTLFCPRCGNRVRPGARFCNKCGGALEG
ncbi:MAG: zinc-ribbon domain-containing protein [Dehalococcoidia bacterium]|nr:zinc-ribbon domain-containing protein [Dehalococcoidia bacterium]